MIDIKDPIQINKLYEVFSQILRTASRGRSSARLEESDKTQRRKPYDEENLAENRCHTKEEDDAEEGTAPTEGAEHPEESEASHRFRQGSCAYERLSADLEAALIELVKLNEPRAPKYFKDFFMPFVQREAKSLYLEEYEDFVSVGMNALAQSAKRFDRSKDVRLTRFARFSVRMAMKREYYKTRAVKVSLKIHRDIRKMSSTASNLRPGREATDREIALSLDWTQDYVRELKQAKFALRCVSLDARMEQDGEDMAVFDIKDAAPGPEEIAEAHERVRIFLQIASRLPSRERRFFKYRCDISDKIPTSVIVEQMLLAPKLVSLEKAGAKMRLTKIQAQRLNDKVKDFLQQNCPGELSYLMNEWKPKAPEPGSVPLVRKKKKRQS